MDNKNTITGTIKLDVAQLDAAKESLKTFTVELKKADAALTVFNDKLQALPSVNFGVDKVVSIDADDYDIQKLVIPEEVGIKNE